MCVCVRWGHELAPYHIAQTHNSLSAVREDVLVPVVLGLLPFSPKFGIFPSCVEATPLSEIDKVSIIIRLLSVALHRCHLGYIL